MARRTRTLIAAAATGLALAGSLLAAPAQADTDSAAATLAVTTAGALSISAPANASSAPLDLGSVASGIGLASPTNGLGTITVTDTRTGLLNNNWSATATISDFVRTGTVNGASTAQMTIPAATIAYNVGTVTDTDSDITSVFTSVGGLPVLGTTTIGTMVALQGNSQSWSPTLGITLTDQVAGTYTGTIVHSAL